MKPFQYLRATSYASAASALAAHAGSVVHSGGVDLLDRLQEYVSAPPVLVGLGGLAAQAPAVIADDGAGMDRWACTLAQLAEDPLVRDALPALAHAAGQAASPQIRHRATVAGNLAQHTALRLLPPCRVSLPQTKWGHVSRPRRDGGARACGPVQQRDVCICAPFQPCAGLGRTRRFGACAPRG